MILFVGLLLFVGLVYGSTELAQFEATPLDVVSIVFIVLGNYRREDMNANAISKEIYGSVF